MSRYLQRTNSKCGIILLDREITQRQQKFGVELYDLLVALDASNKTKVISLPGLFRAKEKQIQGVFKECRADIEALEDTKEVQQREVYYLESQRELTLPATNKKESFSNARKWMTNSGKESQLKAKMVMVRREIHKRKEQFGIEVFDLATGESTPAKGMAKGAIASISSRLSVLSSKEQKIRDVTAQAKIHVDGIRQTKERKLREIEKLQA